MGNILTPKSNRIHELEDIINKANKERRETDVLHQQALEANKKQKTRLTVEVARQTDLIRKERERGDSLRRSLLEATQENEQLRHQAQEFKKTIASLEKKSLESEQMRVVISQIDGLIDQI